VETRRVSPKTSMDRMVRKAPGCDQAGCEHDKRFIS
jgi:hypothetical protein